MYNLYEMETLANMRREEIARQIAAIRLADEATRGRATTCAWRRRLAIALRATAAWLAPTAAESAAGAEPMTA
jgi:hypothetical protein